MTATEIAELASLREERDAARRRLAGLSRVVELISGELALEPLLTRIVESAVELIGAQIGAIWLVRDRPGGAVVQWFAGQNIPRRDKGHEFPAGAGLSGAVLRARRPVCLDRYGDLERPVLDQYLDYAVIGMPIWLGRRIVGIFNIGAPPPRRFTADDVETLTLFARHAAIAIQNARSFEAERRRAREKARAFDELRQALATAELLYHTSQRMSVALTIPEVIAAYLEQVAAGSRYQCSVRLDEIDADGRRTAVIVHGRWYPGQGMRLGEQRLPYTIGEFDALLDAGEVVAVQDYRTDPRISDELRRLQATVGRPAFALIPLIVQGRRIGRVNLSYNRPHRWSEAELQPYQVTAALLAAAIDTRQQHLARAEQDQQLAVLEERRRLARELHDSVTQSLFSMSLLAQTVPELWDLDRAEAERSLAQIRDLTRGALAEMRALLYELRPADQGGWDLARALGHHVAAFERRTGLRVAAAVPPDVDLPDAVAYALSRIAQEALANVAHHAEARQVALTLDPGPPTRLVVADDGRGFAVDQVAADRLGLVSMRERAAAIHARLEITSAPGRGTTLALEWSGPGTVGVGGG